MNTKYRKVLNFLAPPPSTQKEFEDEVIKRARMICRKDKVCTDDFRDPYFWNLYNTATNADDKEDVIVRAAQSIADTTNLWDGN